MIVRLMDREIRVVPVLGGLLTAGCGRVVGRPPTVLGNAQGL
jgi:hypothetical protein